jgi:hypothetical protein
LPGPQAVGELFGKHCWITGGPECVLRDQAGRRMVAVAVSRVALKTRDQDERPVDANHTHDIAQDRFLSPFFERLVEAFREPVVRNRREVLRVDAVVAIGGNQFVGTDQAERVEQLRPDRVVARFATGQGEQRHAGTVTPAEHRQHTAMLVVWMGSGVHRARCRAQLQDSLPRTGRAVVLRQCRARHGCRGKSQNERCAHDVTATLNE